MLLKLGKLGSVLLTIVFFTANANAGIILETQQPDGSYKGIHSVTILAKNLFNEGTESFYDDAAIYSCSVTVPITTFESALNLITFGWANEDKSRFFFASPAAINGDKVSYNPDDLQTGVLILDNGSSAQAFFGYSTPSATGTEVYLSGNFENLADEITIKFDILSVDGTLDDLNLQLRFYSSAQPFSEDITAPEPATILMFWLGAAGIATARRIRRK